MSLGKSKFDLTRSMISATNFGVLQPFLLMDVVPSDDIRLSTDITFRFDPLVLPSFDNYKYQMDYYFVPYRLLDKNFQNILTRIEDPYETKKIKEVVNFKRLSSNSLLGAYGLPFDEDSSVYSDLAVYPLYAYWIVVNYYYRDRLLDPSYNPEFNFDDFDTIDNLDSLYIVNNDIDYFQGAYKDAQLASSTVLDLNKDGFTEVSELKMATRLQQLKEKLMILSRRRGNRYVNYLRDMFGTSPREELLGIPYHIDRVTRNLSVSEVVSTSATDGRPLAGSAGKIFDNVDGSYSSYTVNEHGILLGLLTIKPYMHYVSGAPRIFLKDDFSDFYNPTFVNLGMQELSRKELNISAPKDEVFGYTFRYQELRESYNQVAGSMMDEPYWHSALNLRNEFLGNGFRKVNADRADSPFSYNLRNYDSDSYERYHSPDYYYRISFNTSHTSFKFSRVFYSENDTFQIFKELMTELGYNYERMSAFGIPFDYVESGFTEQQLRNIIEDPKKVSIRQMAKYFIELSRYNFGAISGSRVIVLPLYVETIPLLGKIDFYKIGIYTDDSNRKYDILLPFPDTSIRSILWSNSSYYRPYEIYASLMVNTAFFDVTSVNLTKNLDSVSGKEYYSYEEPNYNIFSTLNVLDAPSSDLSYFKVVYHPDNNGNNWYVTTYSRQMIDYSHIRFKSVTQISALRPLPISYNPVLI